jgi:electron transport complex protein RnfG
MAATDLGLAGRIEQNKQQRLKELMAGLLPQASSFTELESRFSLSDAKGRSQPVVVYRAADSQARCVGWAFVAQGQGFSDRIELIVAVDAGFTRLAGFRVLTCSETPGFGDKIRQPDFQRQFEGAPGGGLELVRFGDRSKVDQQIVAITGATVTSNAVVEILNKTLEGLRSQMMEKGLIGDAG